MTIPTLADAIAVNEALRGEDELPEFFADADELERVQAALDRVAGAPDDPIERAASLLYFVTVEQGFHEGNKRTAYVLARENLLATTPELADALLPEPYDPDVCDLLVAAARGEAVLEELRELMRGRA